MDTPFTEIPSPAVETHLLGQVPLDRCLALQQHLVDEVAQRADGQVRLLLCEHPPLITVGRGGSPGEIQLEAAPIRSGQLPVRWVKRGGGCLVHAPGQLAVYPILPLAWHGFSVGEYLDRFQAGVMNTLDEFGLPVESRPGRHGVWGRTGQLVSFGVAVRDWVTYHGAFINVAPPMGLFRLVQNDPEGSARMSCLQAERRSAARMSAVRAALVRYLADAFGSLRYHLYTGHPMLRESAD